MHKKVSLVISLLIISVVFLAGCSGLVMNALKSGSQAQPSSPVEDLAEAPPADVPPADDSSADALPGTNPAPSADYTFRNTVWGMTIDDVIGSEGRAPDDSDQASLLYNDESVLNMDCSVFYSFSDGKLTDGMYTIDQMHTNENDYITDYQTIVSALTEKYGQPLVSNENWKSDLFKDYPQDYGLAVAAGDLEYISIWDLENVSISCMLSGDNYEISLGILYSDPNAAETGIDTSGL